jgi:ArsR family transcriptional regulator
MPAAYVTPEKIENAVVFLKAVANDRRLLILCHLVDGEKSVTELEALLQIRQPTLSQQLARLRTEKLVKTRRDVKHIFYSLDSDEVHLTIKLLYRLFCSDEERLSGRLPSSLGHAE